MSWRRIWEWQGGSLRERKVWSDDPPENKLLAAQLHPAIIEKLHRDAKRANLSSARYLSQLIAGTPCLPKEPH